MKKDMVTDDRAPRATIWGFHVATLAGFAFAQPLYDLLGREPAFFLAHATEPWGLVLFALFVALVPATVLWSLSVTLALAGPRAAAAGRFAVVTLLVALTLLPALHRGDLADGMVAVVLAGLAAAAAAFLYHRFAAARSLVTVLAPVVVHFPALFLLTSPAAALLRPAPAPAAAGAPVKATMPLVFILFDELPLSSLLDAGEQIDAVRYPGFAELARRSTWYRNATTVSDSTHYAVPAILTGNYPETGRFATHQHHPENLFTWLGGSYELQVVESLTRLCPEKLMSDRSWRPGCWQRWRTLLLDVAVVYSHVLLPPKLTTVLPDITLKWAGFVEEKAVDPRHEVRATGEPAALADRFLKMMESSSSSDSTLYFIHLPLPHFPWKRLPSGKEYGPIGTMIPQAFDPHRFLFWRSDEWLVAQSYQRHLLQVGYSDLLLVELLEKLREVGLYDRALIVVTADHGFTFNPGVAIRSTERSDLAQDLMVIPLFIKRPGQTQGEVSELPVEVTDILPTIAAELGVELPWPADGLRMSDPAVAERSQKMMVGGGHGAEVYTKTVDVADLEGRVTLDRKLALFGSGEEDLFAIGPHPDLLGQAPELFTTAAAGDGSADGWAVELADAWTYEDVDPESRFVPANITGKLLTEAPHGAESEDLELAVAVNGRIRATTRIFVDRLGDLRFAAMVPESSFLAGRNEIDVFVVESGGPPPRLIPTTRGETSSRDLRLVATLDGGDELRTADGTVLPYALNRIRGVAHGNVVFLRGWAADLENLDRPVEIVVFLDERPVARDRADRFFPFIRVDPSLGLKQEVTFQLTVPFAMLPEGTAIRDLRLFAVAEDAAAELKIQVN